MKTTRIVNAKQKQQHHGLALITKYIFICRLVILSGHVDACVHHEQGYGLDAGRLVVKDYRGFTAGRVPRLVHFVGCKSRMDAEWIGGESRWGGGGERTVLLKVERRSLFWSCCVMCVSTDHLGVHQGFTGWTDKRLPNLKCWITGNFSKHSALYIRIRPWLTLAQLGTALMFHS